jgi:hypothetical protein
VSVLVVITSRAWSTVASAKCITLTKVRHIAFVAAGTCVSKHIARSIKDRLCSKDLEVISASHNEIDINRRNEREAITIHARGF